MGQSYFFTGHVGELSHIEKSLCPSSDSMGLLTHPKRKKLNGKNENEHSILAGHADPIYKSWGYKILGKSWGHLKVHIVWSTCYSTKLLIDLTSASVLGLYPIHCNPCHFPLHIVVVREKQSQGLKIQHGDGFSQIEKSLLLGGGSYPGTSWVQCERSQQNCNWERASFQYISHHPTGNSTMY